METAEPTHGLSQMLMCVDNILGDVIVLRHGIFLIMHAGSIPLRKAISPDTKVCSVANLIKMVIGETIMPDGSPGTL